MKVKIYKTAWMRPCKLAVLLGTSKQHINNMRANGRILSKVDRYGNRLVRGK